MDWGAVSLRRMAAQVRSLIRRPQSSPRAWRGGTGPEDLIGEKPRIDALAELRLAIQSEIRFRPRRYPLPARSPRPPTSKRRWECPPKSRN
jgi:hypothetical protein